MTKTGAKPGFRNANHASFGLKPAGMSMWRALQVFFVKDDQGQAVVQVKYGNGETSVTGLVVPT